MLDDGNEYLLKMVGIYGSTASPGTPGQSNNPEDYLDAYTDLLNDVTPQEKAQIEKNLSNWDLNMQKLLPFLLHFRLPLLDKQHSHGAAAAN